MTVEDSALPNEQPLSGSGFFSKLFDFSFSSFVTISIIKVIYGVLIAVAAVVALVILVGLASQGGASIVLGLVLAPLAFIFYVILSRVWMEVLIVLFRVAENTETIANNSRR